MTRIAMILVELFPFGCNQNGPSVPVPYQSDRLIRESPRGGKLKMDTNQFWQIIETSREKSGGNSETQLVRLRKSLDSLSPDEVVAFAEHFDVCDAGAYRWNLWAAAYIIRGGCSDDTFMDFRASLISQGRDIFERTIEDPDSLADLHIEDTESDLFFEGFQYVPQQVYRAKTGRDLPSRKTTFPTSPHGDEWKEEAGDLKRICPRLWKKYGWGED